MDRESVDRLRFDRRLERRRDWVEEGAKDAYIESLPDVTDKMTRGFDQPDETVSTEEPGSSEASPGMTGFSSPDSSPDSTPQSTQDPASGLTPGSFGGGGSESS